jgi:hypothetical protein
MDNNTEDVAALKGLAKDLMTDVATAEREAGLWKSRHDDLLRYFTELRQLYYEKTGIVYESSDLVMSRVAPTDADKEWLRSIGINI